MIPEFFSRKNSIASAIALIATAFMTSATFAGEVTLESPDGAVKLVGEFIEFTNNNYVVRTELGDLRISASRVECNGESCPVFQELVADVKIGGSDTLGEGVMPLMLSGFAASIGAQASVTVTDTKGELLAELTGEDGYGDPAGSFLINSTVSSDAFRKLLDQSIQVGMASRRIRPEEARALRDAGAGNMISTDNEHIIAIDALVVITNPANPIGEMTLDELRGIYSGEISNWSELGGADALITVLDRPEGSGTRAVFQSRLFGDELPASPEGVKFVAGNVLTAATVNEDPNAIGFVGYAFQRGAQAVTLTNDCGIITKPDPFSARTEEYPLQRLLYLYNRTDDLKPETSELIEFSTSPNADEVIAKAGFIDLGIDRREQPLDSMRGQQLLGTATDAYEGSIMREMMSEMVNYDRLSATFRFQTGSSALDTRGLLSLERLASYLEIQPVGTKIRFVGFTDDVGAFEGNRTLSIGRAQQVLDALQEFAGDRLSGIEMSVTGFGEIAPSTCNNSEDERRINRRVEVWIQNAD